jgi:hypothetical protein|tara:strand:- start:2660 stop:3040 length:381 start_codon:yes stop_codon:yes gene_type:complete
MKLKDLLNEKKNDQGVLVVTKKAEVNKFIKQVEKAEKELNKAKDLFSDLYSPARSFERAEKNSFYNYERDSGKKLKQHNSNYATEVENLWANIAGGINGNIVFSLGKIGNDIRTVKNKLSELLRMM